MEKIEASFSMLAMSIASSAAIAMGLAPDPQTGKTHPPDKTMARFNIDLLMVLRDKSKNNLTPEEQKLLDSLVSDLQLKFVNC